MIRYVTQYKYRYRPRIDIIAGILNAIIAVQGKGYYYNNKQIDDDGAILHQISKKSRTSHSVVYRYLEMLVRYGLVFAKVCEMKRRRGRLKGIVKTVTTYQVTDKGLEFLEAHKLFKDLFIS
jgi:predicted transcriptional regulator